jgi:hypothetical protein
LDVRFADSGAEQNVNKLTKERMELERLHAEQKANAKAAADLEREKKLLPLRLELELKKHEHTKDWELKKEKEVIGSLTATVLGFQQYFCSCSSKSRRVRLR